MDRHTADRVRRGTTARRAEISANRSSHMSGASSELSNGNALVLEGEASTDIHAQFASSPLNCAKSGSQKPENSIIGDGKWHGTCSILTTCSPAISPPQGRYCAALGPGPTCRSPNCHNEHHTIPKAGTTQPQRPCHYQDHKNRILHSHHMHF